MASKTDGIIRVGGVGTGRIFQWAHLNPYLPLLNRARLVGFFDTNTARAEQARRKYEDTLKAHAEKKPQFAEAIRENLAQLKVYSTLDEMLANVDLIDICTFTQGRMDAAVEALKKGVHSMGEKPMARNWIEANAAEEAFKKNSKAYFQLNDDNVFDPKYLAMRALIRQGVIGAPQKVQIIRGSRLDSTTVLKSQASAMSNGGGCIMDYGSHGLAGVWWVLGTNFQFRKVQAISVDVLFPDRVLEGEPSKMTVDDNAQFKILMEDPTNGTWVTIFMETTWCGGHIGPHSIRKPVGGGGLFIVEGDEGVLDASAHDKITLTRWDGGESVYPLKEYPGETISFENEIGTMVRCIETSTPPDIDASYGAEIIATCGAVYYSKLMGRTVSVEEFKDYCRGYVKKHKDMQAASVALLNDLLAPYAKKGMNS